MKYYLIVIIYLLILFPLCLQVHSYGIFFKNNTIAHPETGLFLDSIGLYTPSEAIIHNSAIFPMTTATCHFIPLSAAKNIPSCNITRKRNKRHPAAIIIALGIGAFGIGMSSSNNIQMSRLEKQVAVVDRSLSEFSRTLRIQGAYLVKIESNQIKLGEELQLTQKALNAMVPVLNSHSEALNTLKTDFERLQSQFQHSFLHSAMTQIFRNQLNLDYLTADDLHKAVYDVIEQGNLTFGSHQGSLPIAQIITKFLVRQQVDFVPKSEYIPESADEIGRLVISNYFAVPQQGQTSFHVYKLLAIPFFHENETIQLANMPRYWAINPADNNTIEWHDPQEFGCELQLMATCRDTPPFRKISKDTCFDQIVGGLPLTKCQTEPAPHAPFFLQQLRDNFWIVSSPVSMHCLKIPKTEYRSTIQYSWSMNEEIILPPVAIVNVTPGYVVACPGFTLVGRPILRNTSSLVLWYKNSMTNISIPVVDVHRYIIANTTWFKRALDDQEIKTLMNLIHETNTVSTIQDSSSMHMWSYGILIFCLILFALSSGLVYYAFRCK